MLKHYDIVTDNQVLYLRKPRSLEGRKIIKIEGTDNTDRRDS